MSSILSIEEIGALDRQIELLTDYKPIPEHEVKALCEKVIHFNNHELGQGNPCKREQCAACQMSGYCVRGHPWIVPRLNGAIQNWGEISRHQLSLYGRLCGQRILLSRDCDLVGVL